MIRKFISYLKGIYRGDHAYMNSKLNWYLYKFVDSIKNLVSLEKEKINSRDEIIEIAVKRINHCVDKSNFSLDDFLENKFYWPKYIIDLPKYSFSYEDELYKQIKMNGFKSQKELKNNVKNDEVMTIIDSNGQYILINGYKRLMVAKNLNIKKIAVKIVKRHNNWIKFKVSVKKEEQQSGVYQQVLHPDFEDVKFHRKGETRWDLIKSSLPINAGSVLDIGSNWGYFSHKFEDTNFQCTAVERNFKCNYFLERFKEIERKNFDIYNGSIFKIPKMNYDIVLALSIFHGFIRNKSAYDKMTELLSKLEMKYMFFEPHKGDEIDDGFHVNYNPEQFVEYIINNSCLNHYEYLGESTRERKLFLLAKEKINVRE
tara:strand:- start:2084 stop:3196 length:1113 start_codon:yes stop_codon:yes gene_type:complete